MESNSNPDLSSPKAHALFLNLELVNLGRLHGWASEDSQEPKIECKSVTRYICIYGIFSGESI